LPATSKICMSFRVIKRVSRTRRATPQPLKAHQRHKSNLQGEEEAPAIENEAPQKPKTNKQQTESHKQSLRKLSGTSCKRGLHTRKYQTPSRKMKRASAQHIHTTLVNHRRVDYSLTCGVRFCCRSPSPLISYPQRGLLHTEE
jgi:hypothetical protein